MQTPGVGYPSFFSSFFFLGAFDDTDDGQDEAHPSPQPAPTPRLALEEVPRLRLSHRASRGRRTPRRSAIFDPLTVPPPEPFNLDTAESARVAATERPRSQAETAQNRNIAVELSPDGDRITWLRRARAAVPLGTYIVLLILSLSSLAVPQRGPGTGCETREYLDFPPLEMDRCSRRS
jgi:hypothetical protein